jgi:hypothetical protein
LIDDEKSGAQGDPEREAEFWVRKIAEVQVERRGYQRLGANGHMTEEELGAALGRVWQKDRRASRPSSG